MRAQMGTSKDTALVTAWHELLEAHARTTSSLERRLQQDHGLGVSEYEVLERLAGAETQESRMQELADEGDGVLSALSRVVARLEGGRRYQPGGRRPMVVG